jgi:cell division protein FtsZ
MSDFLADPVPNNAPDEGITMPSNCIIRVVGVGGGGCNMLQHMINESLSSVEFIAVNTDIQALKKSTAPTRVQIGVKLTEGLGVGCDPNKGRKAAEESKEDIKNLLQGSKMIFITAGMGGGTGTGAAPVIAEMAKATDPETLVVGVVTKPFKFEGKRHMINAESGITELSKHVDSLIIIDNDKLLKNLGTNISIVNAFNAANDVLLNAVRGITEFITNSSYINTDFADVKTVMRGRGHAIIGLGVGQGANFVKDAVDHAIHSPLIEPVDISSATGLLVNVRVNPNFPITKLEEISNAVQEYADDEADCKFGLFFDESFAEDQIAITILIAGISTNADEIARTAPQMQPQANAMRPNAAPQMSNMGMQRDFFGGFANNRQAAPASRQMPPMGTGFFDNAQNRMQMQPNAQMMPPSNRQMMPNQTQFYQQPQMQAPMGRTPPLPQAEVPNAQENRRVEQFSDDDLDITITQAPAARQNEENKVELWDMPPILRNKSE